MFLYSIHIIIIICCRWQLTGWLHRSSADHAHFTIMLLTQYLFKEIFYTFVYITHFTFHRLLEQKGFFSKIDFLVFFFFLYQLIIMAFLRLAFYVKNKICVCPLYYLLLYKTIKKKNVANLTLF